MPRPEVSCDRCSPLASPSHLLSASAAHFRIVLGGALVCSVFLPLLTSTVAHAEDALAALRADYTGSRASCRVKVDGLQAGRDLLGRPSEIKVVNGVVAHSFLQDHSNQAVHISLGEMVRVSSIGTVGNAKNDILQVTVVAHGLPVPIDFQVEKGSLASMSEEQLQQLIGAVLEPPAAASPAQAASSTIAASQARDAAPSQSQQASATPLATGNVKELDSILRGHGGDALVKIPGIRAVMSSPNYVSDNFILDGVFHPEMHSPHAAGMRDLALWPNSVAQFIELTAFTDEEHDYLHLVVRAPVGAFAPITWVFAKGKLATMSKSDIMKAIDPIVVFAAADEGTFRKEGALAPVSSSEHGQRAAGETLSLAAPVGPLGKLIETPPGSTGKSVALLLLQSAATKQFGEKYTAAQMNQVFALMQSNDREMAGLGAFIQDTIAAEMDSTYKTRAARLHEDALRKRCTADLITQVNTGDVNPSRSKPCEKLADDTAME